MRAVEIILGLLVIMVVTWAGWDRCLSPLLKEMTAKEKVMLLAQILLGTIGIWVLLVVVIILAPET